MKVSLKDTNISNASEAKNLKPNGTKVWFKDIDEDFDEIFYSNEYPDALPFYENLKNISLRERMFNHYKRFCKDGSLFKNFKEKEKVWTTNVDEDFDDVFYLEEYPHAKSFYENWVRAPLRERLFNHYKKFGSQNKLFKNLKEKEQQETDNTLISNRISLTDILFKGNILECICLLLTDKELSTGVYDKFLFELRNKTTSKETRDLNLKIISNQSLDIQKLNLKFLKSMFKEVDVISLEIPPKDDVYIREKIDFNFPAYGAKSGPNIMFFKSIKLCQEHNTTLFLETDCFFKPGWLYKIKNFVKHSNGFWISGATYDGSGFCKANSLMMTHINGGTALYATGNKNLQTFIEMSEEFVLKRIKEGDCYLAYDYGIKMFIDYNINNNFSNPYDVLVWKMINRQYTPNNLIGNFSTSNDTHLSLEEIDKIYNYYIIHKKI